MRCVLLLGWPAKTLALSTQHAGYTPLRRKLIVLIREGLSAIVTEANCGEFLKEIKACAFLVERCKYLNAMTTMALECGSL